jgi:hypothetical protein
MAGESSKDLSVGINLCVVDLGVAWFELLILQLIVLECIRTSNENEFRLMWVVRDLEIELLDLTFHLSRNLRWKAGQTDVDLGSDLDLIPIPHKE